jgi:hypothetical protein
MSANGGLLGTKRRELSPARKKESPLLYKKGLWSQGQCLKRFLFWGSIFYVRYAVLTDIHVSTGLNCSDNGDRNKKERKEIEIIVKRFLTLRSVICIFNSGDPGVNRKCLKR